MLVMSSLAGLKPSQYRKYVRAWNRNRYKSLFQKFTKDPRAYRIYLPMGEQGAFGDDMRPVPERVLSYLNNLGYSVTDYSAGLAEKEGRTVRIGKVLKDTDVKKEFDNDPHRQAVKVGKNLLVVISRHPYDIARMSTGRGWTSCMDLEDGENTSFVLDDVKCGTLVAYLIHEDDQNINRPISRMLIKPFKKLDGRAIKLVPEGKMYGANVPQFAHTLDTWAAEVNGEMPDLHWYKLNKKLYADGPEGRLLGTLRERNLRTVIEAANFEGADYFSAELKKQLPKFAQYLADNADSLGLNLSTVTNLIERGAFEFFTPEQAAQIRFFPEALSYGLAKTSSPSSVAQAMYCLIKGLIKIPHSDMSLALTLAVLKNKKLSSLVRIKKRMGFDVFVQENAADYLPATRTVAVEDLLEINRLSGKKIPHPTLLEVRERFSPEDFLKLARVSAITTGGAVQMCPALLRLPEIQNELIDNPPPGRIKIRAKSLRSLLFLPVAVFRDAKFCVLNSSVRQNKEALKDLTAEEVYSLRVELGIEGFDHEQYEKLATLITGDEFYRAVYADWVDEGVKLSPEALRLAGPIDNELRLKTVVRELAGARFLAETDVDLATLEIEALKAVAQGVRIENKQAYLSRLAILTIGTDTKPLLKTYVSFLPEKQRVKYYPNMKTCRA